MAPCVVTGGEEKNKADDDREIIADTCAVVTCTGLEPDCLGSNPDPATWLL